MLNNYNLTTASVFEYKTSVNSYLGQLLKDMKSPPRDKPNDLYKELPLEYLGDVIIQLCRQNSLHLNDALFLFMKCHFEISFIYNYLNKQHYSDLNENESNDYPLKWFVSLNDPEKLESFKYLYGASAETISSIIYPIMSSFLGSQNEILGTKDHFSTYLLSMILNDSISFGLKDEETKYFKECWEMNISLLHGKIPEEKKQWWHLAESFFGLHKEIGDNYLQLDSLKVRNAVIETNWLKSFSTYEVKLKELANMKKLLEIQITIKNQDASLPESKCLQLAKLELLKEEQELKRLINNSTWASCLETDKLIKYLPKDSPVLNEYRLKAEKYFRIAVKLLHPDRRSWLLKDKILMKEQEKELDNLYNEVVSIREKKSLTPMDLVFGDYFSVNQLKRIVSKAETILSAYGISPKIKLMILGKDYDSQIDFLTNEYNLLNTELAKIQAEVQILYSDKDAYQKNNILKDPEAIEAIHKRYNDIIEHYSNEIAMLNNELKLVFAE